MRPSADPLHEFIPSPDLVFLNRLLQLQHHYYAGGCNTAFILQLLHELCTQAKGNAAGLIRQKNRAQDMFINGAETWLGKVEQHQAKVESQVIDPFSCGAPQVIIIGNKNVFVIDIRTDNELVAILYLVAENKVLASEIYERVQPALPILLGMLFAADLSGNAIRELEHQRLQTENLESLISSLDDIILEMDENTIIRKVWVKDETKLFLTKELFIDRSLTDVLGGFADIFIDCINELLLSGEKQECTYPDFNLDKDQWYCARFQKIDATPSGQGMRLICVIEDITAKKRLSDQLEQSTSELKRLNTLLDIGLEISKMGGWEYHILSQELFVTRQIYDITEIDAGTEINYKSVLDSFDQKDKSYLINTLKSAFEQCVPFDIELELTSALQHKKWVRLSGIPVVENEEITLFRGILKDITHNRKNEQDLIDAKNLAERTASDRTEVLSVMSHEIRTPLNGIIGICNLLNQINFPDPQISTYLGHLSFSCNHLLNLVNDILDLEKITNQKMQLNEAEIDLVALVKNVRRQFLPLAKAKQLDLKLVHDQLIPTLMRIDDLRLGRILNNLIGNAIKFTEKGEICLSLTTTKKDGDRVGILFRVTDTGIGIPEHLQELIFDRFHQVQQAGHRQQQGTGLGLSITKGLVNLFKSEIHLTSKLNEGTSFEFEIDFEVVRFPHLKKAPFAVEELFPLLPDLKLLIVDDNQVNLLVASGQLRHFGIHAKEADSGVKALEMLEQQRFDIILIDLHMPEMDGYQLAKRVQAEHRETKVVIFTADVLDEVRARLRAMDIHHLLSKPFDPDEMRQLLLEVVNNGD